MDVYKFSAVLQSKHFQVWRRFVVPTSMTFADLSDTLMCLFGYRGTELYEFVFDALKARITNDAALCEQAAYLQSEAGKAYLETLDQNEVEVDISVAVARASATPLAPLVEKYKQFHYIYDLTDEWWYDIKFLERIDDYDAVAPQVLEGLGTAPFEAVGGEEGYEALVTVLTDPGHPDNASLRAWVDVQGYQFYDPEIVNARLRGEGL